MYAWQVFCPCQGCGPYIAYLPGNKLGRSSQMSLAHKMILSLGYCPARLVVHEVSLRDVGITI